MKKDNNKTVMSPRLEKGRFIPGENRMRDKETLLPIHAVQEKRYNRDSDEDMDPEGLIEMELDHKLPGNWNEMDFSKNGTGNDRDVQGADLDDEEEAIGSVDDGKNYYCIGGDGQMVLDECIIN